MSVPQALLGRYARNTGANRILIPGWKKPAIRRFPLEQSAAVFRLNAREFVKCRC